MILLSAGLLALDYGVNGLTVVRSIAGVIAKPYYQISSSPKHFASAIGEHLNSRSQLLAENRRLKARERILSAKVQKMAALSAENGRLRALLNSKAILGDDDITVAELIGVNPDLHKHLITIDKGSLDKVFDGQPVIDASGLVGQVIHVSRNSAQVMLITDELHAVPVQVNRNGLRAVATGIGLIDELVLSNVGSTADIKVGDLLVSSGLGDRFPAGYPVARVSNISVDASSPFLEVSAQPLAELSRSRYLLLVFPKE